MPLACAPESSAATAHSQTGRRRRPIAAPGSPPGPARGSRRCPPAAAPHRSLPGSRRCSRLPELAGPTAWRFAEAASRGVAGAARG